MSFAELGGAAGTAIGGPAGAFIGGAAGTLIDQKLSNKGKLSPAQQIYLQERSSLQQQKDAFNLKMEQAKSYGIHPLALLGVPTSSFSPTISQSQDYSSLGDGASQIAKSFVQPPNYAPVEDRSVPHKMPVDPRVDEILTSNARLAKTQADKAEWDFAMSQMNWLGQPGRPPAVRSSNDTNYSQAQVAAQSGLPLSYFSGKNPAVSVEQTVLPPHPDSFGFAAATQQPWLNVMDRDGKQVPIINSDVISADIEDGATFQALSKIFGIEKALAMTAALEQSGPIGTVLGVGALAARQWYRNMAKQRADALKRRMNPRVIVTDRNKPPRRDSYGRIIPRGTD